MLTTYVKHAFRHQTRSDKLLQPQGLERIDSVAIHRRWWI